jgi:hypothetical protein
MKRPQLVLHRADEWLARQLADLAAESRWLIRTAATRETALGFLRDPRPTVAFIHIDPHDDSTEGCELLAECHCANPDAALVAASEAKLPDVDRVAWTGMLFDLGARYVLFPPLNRPVLEDLTSGLMATAIQRLGGPAPAAPPGEVIDLAEED